MNGFLTCVSKVSGFYRYLVMFSAENSELLSCTFSRPICVLEVTFMRAVQFRRLRFIRNQLCGRIINRPIVDSIYARKFALANRLLPTLSTYAAVEPNTSGDQILSNVHSVAISGNQFHVFSRLSID
jgi:hypothetical protein